MSISGPVCILVESGFALSTSIYTGVYFGLLEDDKTHDRPVHDPPDKSVFL